MKYLIGIYIALVLMFSVTFTGCATSTTQPTEVVNETPYIPLYWENTTAPHPERKIWTQVLLAGLQADFDLYANAEDVTEFCPKFKSLSHNDKLKALGEFLVALAYFESGFNPLTNSVDVGSPNDKGSWSVGLYQLSANDNSAKEVGASFEELQDPKINILVMMIQMKKQISKRSKFMLDNSDSMRYWAVILKGNKFSKIEDYKITDKNGKVTGPFPGIKSRVLKYASKCG